MRRLAFGFILLAMVVVCCPSFAAGTPCAQLRNLTIPNVVVTGVIEMVAGAFHGDPADQLETPEFCRVEAAAHPTSDSDIKIEIWMPARENWNGKLEGVGNGGYMGNIPYSAMAAGLRRGYAVAATDTGHQGDDLRFGQGHPEKVVDWAYRAIHITADVARLVVRDYMGASPKHSYFVGCSTGGHQALSEAQRFPADYDGIVAGDPAYDRVHQTAAYLWNWEQTHDNDGAPIIAPAQLKLVTQAAIAACDAKDGASDGVIGDPESCKIDFQKLACKSSQSDDTCLTPRQIDAFQKIYAGTKNPRTGEEIFPGWTVGSESNGPGGTESWNAYILGPKQPMRIDVFRYFVFDDPNWDWHTFDFDKDVALADEKIGYMSAIDANLKPFRDRGNKLLMYTGWEDPVEAPEDVVKYYKSVVKAMGGQDKTTDFLRFFMVPGMAHCTGGPGPFSFDPLDALDAWVDKGQTPESIPAAHLEKGKPTMTRSLCPYPALASWKGTRDVNDAANWVCRAAASASPATKR